MTDNVSISVPAVQRRVRRKLDALIANKMLTKNGLDWLVVATDPFHDSQVSCEGYPDVESSRTIVQCVTQTINVGTPRSDDLNWSAHVFLFPSTPSWDPGNGGSIAAGAFYQATVAPQGNVTELPQLSLPPIYGGYNIIACADQVDWLTQSANITSTNAVAWPTTFGAGQVRLIAAGYEVTNTTAEIYKQGTVTSYRSPAIKSVGQILLTPAETNYVPRVCEYSALPPTTQYEAALFPNSVTWNAADGVYSIATLNSSDNSFTSPVPCCTAMIQTPTQASLLASQSRFVYMPAFTFASGSYTYVAASSTHAVDFDVHGSVFSGLSAQTTLQITTKYYFERIPDTSDPNLLVLCKPSPIYDPRALEIYSHALSELPVAVKVDENPLGEWFEGVVNVVADALPTIGSLIPLPGAGAAAAMVGQGVRSLGNANREARQAEEMANAAQATANAAKAQSQAIIATQRARNSMPKNRLVANAMQDLALQQALASWPKSNKKAMVPKRVPRRPRK